MKKFLTMLWILWGSTFYGYCQGLMVSQFAAVHDPIKDEYGNVLRGNSLGVTEVMGYPHVQGEIVQVIFAPSNVIYPPDPETGMPTGDNVLHHTARIGMGVSPNIPQPGKFGIGFRRLSHNAKVFARVFNADELEEASFYQDSELYRIDNTSHHVWRPVITQTDIPIDDTDTDGDGLHNSWEKSIGTDTNDRDTDGDGVDDWQEHIAGTDGLDGDEHLRITKIEVVGHNTVKLTWDSRPGKRYRIHKVGKGWTKLEGSKVVKTVDATTHDTSSTILKNIQPNAHFVIEVEP